MRLRISLTLRGRMITRSRRLSSEGVEISGMCMRVLGVAKC